jgi:hypothetical protein
MAKFVLEPGVRLSQVVPGCPGQSGTTFCLCLSHPIYIGWDEQTNIRTVVESRDLCRDNLETIQVSCPNHKDPRSAPNQKVILVATMKLSSRGVTIGGGMRSRVSLCQVPAAQRHTRPGKRTLARSPPKGSLAGPWESIVRIPSPGCPRVRQIALACASLARLAHRCYRRPNASYGTGVRAMPDSLQTRFTRSGQAGLPATVHLLQSSTGPATNRRARALDVW